MFQLRVLKVQFDAELQRFEIPAFRGAIASKVPRESVLFHNHTGEKLRYGYPLIQYKLLQRKPAIVCLGEGVDKIHEFFQQKDWNIHLSGRDIDMKIASLNLNQFTMQVWEKSFDYQISRWIALSEDAYKEYLAMESMVEQLAFLETKLIGNIIALAKGIGWQIDRQISCKITETRPTQTVKVKGVKMIGFNLDFKSNVFLPNDLGLGRKTSIGFGTLQQKRSKSAENGRHRR